MTSPIGNCVHLKIIHISRFTDPEREQIPRVANAPTKRDVFFASRADLLILIWDGQSGGTKNLIDWLSNTGKDHIVGFTLPPEIMTVHATDHTHSSGRERA